MLWDLWHVPCMVRSAQVRYFALHKDCLNKNIHGILSAHMLAREEVCCNTKQSHIQFRLLHWLKLFNNIFIYKCSLLVHFFQVILRNLKKGTVLNSKTLAWRITCIIWLNDPFPPKKGWANKNLIDEPFLY